MKVNQMNILVVIPKFTSSPAQNYIFPMGIAYVTAALKKSEFSTKTLDLNSFSEPPGEVLARAIHEHNIDVVATGTISAHFDKVKTVLEAARRAKPRIVTIVGGGVMSSEPEVMMESLNPNFGVLGEGEKTIVELARELSSSRKYSEVNGLIFREPDGRLRTTLPRAAIRDLNQIAFPDFELLEGYYQKQPRIYNLVGSRSCPYKCTFCYHPIGDLYRQRTADDLFLEIEQSYRKFSPYHYRVIDELFSIKRDRVTEFCKRIKPYNVKWDVQMRVSDVDQELLDMMRDAGCVLVSYGLESGSQKVLESMKKHTRVPDMARAVDITYASRLQVQGAFIFGDPAETHETAVETFSFWLQHRKAGIGMWPIEVYPGTGLYKDAVKKGTIPDPAAYIANGCRSVNISGLPEREVLQTHLLMYLLAITYNRVPAKVLDCQPAAVVAKAGQEAPTQLYDVKVCCPHCDETVDYKNMPMYGGQKWVCTSCNRRYDVQPLSQWRHWPATFQISQQYVFQESHPKEMRQFLAHKNDSNGVKLPGYKEVILFGVHYLVPASFTMDDIRFGLMKIFMINEKQNRLDPVVIYDGDYSILHSPFYLNYRVEELTKDWRARACTVAVAGPSGEIKNLLKWTCLKESKIAGLLPIDPKDAQMANLGFTVLNLDQLLKNPPKVLLVAAARNQRQLCELFGDVLGQFGVEIVALYSSGTNF